MPDVQIPLVTDYHKYAGPSPASGDSTTSSYMKNCIVENDGDKPAIMRRNGILFEREAGSQYIYGIFASATVDEVIAVEDTGAGTYYTSRGIGVGTAIGNLTNSMVAFSDRAYFCDTVDGYCAVHARNANDENVYIIDSSYTQTRLTNATHGFPTGSLMANGIAYMDGYCFVAQTDGKIYNSNVGDVTTWTSTDFISAERYQDSLQYICSHKNSIAAIGSTSVEFFYNAGNPSGSPLARRNDVFYNVGVVTDTFSTGGNPRVDSLEDLIAFIGTNQQGVDFGNNVVMGVYVIEDYQLRKISTESIDKRLAKTSNIKIFQVPGRTLIAVRVQAGATDDTLVYDMNSGVWGVWTYSDAVNSDEDIPFYLMASHRHWLGLYTAEALDVTDAHIADAGQTASYSFDGDFTNGWASYTTEIVTKPWSGGTQRNKFMYTLALGDYSMPEEGTTIAVSWSDDYGLTWTTPRSINYNNNSPLHRLGMFKSRKFKLTFTENFNIDTDNMRLTTMEAVVSGGGNFRSKA